MAAELKDQGLPTVFSESLNRKCGLIIFTGRADVGALEILKTSLAQLKDREVIEWKPSMDPIKGSRTAVLLVQSDNKNDLEAVLSKSEAGHLVVWMLNAPTPMTALRRLLSQDFGEGRVHMLWRMAEQLVLMIGQMKLQSSEASKLIDIYEVILMTPSLKTALEKEKIETIEDGLRSASEGSGMVSFNQSLLQHLLRRNIDIKTAFESTRDPMNLDQILKKVGI